jgi:protein CpxP
MTTMTRISLGIAPVVIAIGLVAGASAQNTNGGPGPFNGRGGPPPGGRFGGPGRGGPLGLPGPILQQLNLSDAQKDRVKSIADAHRDEMKSVHDRAMTTHQALDAAINADVFDEAAIRTRSTEVAAVDADMAVLHARIRSEMFQVLTPEQQAQAKALMAERPQGRGGRERARGPRPPRPPQ